MHVDSGMQMVRLPNKSAKHPTGIATLPALYSSEIGLTSDKFLPINETVTALPLRVSFDRSDVEEAEHQQSKITTATAGAISPARWRLLRHMSEAIEAQKSLGFEQSDIDEVSSSIVLFVYGIIVIAPIFVSTTNNSFSCVVVVVVVCNCRSNY